MVVSFHRGRCWVVDVSRVPGTWTMMEPTAKTTAHWTLQKGDRHSCQERTVPIEHREHAGTVIQIIAFETRIAIPAIGMFRRRQFQHRHPFLSRFRMMLIIGFVVLVTAWKGHRRLAQRRTGIHRRHALLIHPSVRRPSVRPYGIQ
jgi:hypothetical protein